MNTETTKKLLEACNNQLIMYYVNQFGKGAKNFIKLGEYIQMHCKTDNLYVMDEDTMTFKKIEDAAIVINENNDTFTLQWTKLSSKELSESDFIPIAMDFNESFISGNVRSTIFKTLVDSNPDVRKFGSKIIYVLYMTFRLFIMMNCVRMYLEDMVDIDEFSLEEKCVCAVCASTWWNHLINFNEMLVHPITKKTLFIKAGITIYNSGEMTFDRLGCIYEDGKGGL